MVLQALLTAVQVRKPKKPSFLEHSDQDNQIGLKKNNNIYSRSIYSPMAQANNNNDNQVTTVIGKAQSPPIARQTVYAHAQGELPITLTQI